MDIEMEILSMPLEEAYNMFKIEAEKTGKAYRSARFGDKIYFDINDYFKGHIRIKSKSGKVLIKGRMIESEDFYTELESREKYIKDWLLKSYSKQSPFKPRSDVNG